MKFGKNSFCCSRNIGKGFVGTILFVGSDKCWIDENESWENLSRSRSLSVLDLFPLVCYFSNKNSISSEIADSKSFILIRIKSY